MLKSCNEISKSELILRETLIRLLPIGAISPENLLKMCGNEDRLVYPLQKFISVELLTILTNLSKKKEVTLDDLYVVGGAYKQLGTLFNLTEADLKKAIEINIKTDLSSNLKVLISDWSAKQGVGYGNGADYGYDHELTKEEFLISYGYILNAIFRKFLNH